MIWIKIRKTDKLYAMTQGRTELLRATIFREKAQNQSNGRYGVQRGMFVGEEPKTSQMPEKGCIDG
jgi:hypothetical protein